MSQEGPLKKPKLLDNVHKETAGEIAEQEEERYMSSPDMFADSCSPCAVDDEKNQQFNDVVIQIENDTDINMKSKYSLANGDQAVDWKGTSLEDILNGCDLPQLPPIKPTEHHRVLFRVPIAEGEVPEPYPCIPESAVEDLWDSYHVRMPNSRQSQYLGESNNGEQEMKSRWSIIKAAFAKPIKSSQELADAILSYNSKYAHRWNFQALHYFFHDELNEEEQNALITRILPSIIALALTLPTEIKAPIPLLRRNRSRSLSLSQRQAAVLLANAFLCTFPRRNALGSKAEYAAFPDINFNRLFCSNDNGRPLQRQIEKLKCIFHYFGRILKKAPQGVLTFSRRFIEKSRLPRWDRQETRLTPLHVTSSGTIEDQGTGMLQADFANSMVGGGVLGSGCVQEEIRFVVCPELILARLFTEELDATEALIIAGCERFSCYEGYADSFEWTSDYRDVTSRDASGRRRCVVVAIDALFLRNPNAQFAPKCMLREVNKVFVGCFNPGVDNRLSAFATGNWGCGAFGGDSRLKAVLQLMAAAAAKRGVAYFTFGDVRLRDELHSLHDFLVEQRVTIARLWAILSSYHVSFEDKRPTCDLYTFIYDAVLKESELHYDRAKCNRKPSPRHKTSGSEMRGRSDAGASTSHYAAPETPEALEATEAVDDLLTCLRRAIPEMDDATREAKLARIEAPVTTLPGLSRRDGSESPPNAFAQLLLEADEGVEPDSGEISPASVDLEAECESRVEVKASSESSVDVKAGNDSKVKLTKMNPSVSMSSSFGTKQKSSKITDYFASNSS